MSDDQIRLNAIDRSDDQMMEIDLMPSDGRSAHYAIASVVVRMDGQASDSPDLVSFAERLVSRYNACAGMADPASEIAELKRQRDELLEVLGDAIQLIKQARLDWCGQNAESYDEDVVTPYDAILYRPILSLLETKGSAS